MPYTETQKTAFSLLAENQGAQSFQVQFEDNETLSNMRAAFAHCGCRVVDAGGNCLEVSMPDWHDSARQVMAGEKHVKGYAL